MDQTDGLGLPICALSQRELQSASTGVPRPMEVCTGKAQSLSQTCQLCKSKVFLQLWLLGISPAWLWGEGKGGQRVTVGAVPHICRTCSGRVACPPPCPALNTGAHSRADQVNSPGKSISRRVQSSPPRLEKHSSLGHVQEHTQPPRSLAARAAAAFRCYSKIWSFCIQMEPVIDETG